MKKLISIGVALALLALAVVPGAVAAYELPDTYSKVPFAIVQSIFDLVGTLLDAMGGELGLPEWLDSALMSEIGGWAGGPLSWTVDMLAWGLSLTGDVIGALDAIIAPIAELPFPLADVSAIFDTIACGLMTCFAVTECTGNFTPCG
ncbi:MAG: hypothetical protein A2Z77_00790 [Chloroflexi bacterium RBG_13_51_36]|nr:MAG: hypothetical protein A2Z77_00790 [Chloroflexi bacterium RBG_13_51_36]